ncbi:MULTISPECIES: heme utilization protein [Pseudomonas]|uniref:heme utilization protein n=1 Tax=Pseudomonas TaxID=286 RepID=UPI001BE61D62|nr:MULTISPECIES: heme utilization protein [Pseudomonas]MBT2341135.1 heme utilization protein [Pseudomonas fluorescens]MCD4529052.1 heme utilization protein [Pseudomonas sp. C3-2018]
MKPTMALKPLVFALAAVMAMAAQAGGNDNNHGHGHGDHGPKGPTWQEQLAITAGSAATVLDEQNSDGNVVTNQATKNTADAKDSLNGSNGNMGANVAAGDGNQQDNAAALATADESFIFGSAVAMSSATQVNNNNSVKNNSTQNNASLTNAGNNGSGNIGINVTAGNFNQQKNNLAIAVSGGRVATASAAADQTSTGLEVDNKGVRTYKTDTLTSTYKASGTFKAKGSGTSEGDDHGGWDNRNGGYGGGHDDDKFKFSAVGTFDLAGSNTQQVLTRDGWKNPVINNATMNNSMNGFSGNGGANVSAGVGNQQSNSLSIAAGCKACM